MKATAIGSMKAIQVDRSGGPEVLKPQNVKVPQPGEGEVLVQVKAAGVNFADIYQRKSPAPQPYIPGREGCGLVEDLGPGVEGVRVGDRVAYAGAPGSYAAYQVVKAAQLIPLPEGFTFEQGAAFPLQGLTAHYLTHEFRRIRPGDVVLVQAAAGGVGLLLVQWLKRMGARVFGTTSTPQKADLARQAGAEQVILYTQADFAEEVKRLTQGKGADYIIDGVGSTFAKDLEAVAVRGNICVFGAAGGPAEPVSPNALMAKSVTLSGGSMGNYLRDRQELLMRAGELIQGIQEGWLKVKIDRVFPLDQAAEAQQLLESRGSVGKLVLQI